MGPVVRSNWTGQHLDSMERQIVNTFVDNNTENRCFVDIAFVKLLLPNVRKHVTQQLFMLLEERSKYGSKQSEVLPGLAPKDLFECGDVRKFLNIMLNVGCFTSQQQNLAYKLKHNRELFAKEELIPDSVKSAVYEDVKALLETFSNTGEDLENLENAWAYGAGYFLKPAKDDVEKEGEIESLRKEVEEFKLQQENQEVENDSSEPSVASDEFYYSDDEEEEAVKPAPQILKSYGLDTKQETSPESYNLFSRSHGFSLEQLSPRQQPGQVSSSSLYPAIQLLLGDEDTSKAILKIIQKLPVHHLTSMMQSPQLLRNRVEEALEILSRQNLSAVNQSALQYVDNSEYKQKTAPHPSFFNADQPNVVKSKPQSLRSAPEAPKSWSAAAAKTPSEGAWTTPAQKEKKKIEKVPVVAATAPETATATSVGYKLNHQAPKPDPRFRGDAQVMMGPIPGILAHEDVYVEMRTNFSSRGRVKFQYLSPSFTDKTGKSVKFGYVVFEEKADAQKVIKEGSLVLLKKYKIKMTKMC